MSFHVFSLFKTFQKALSLSLRLVQILHPFFCRFSLNLSQGLCRLAPVRPFLLFLFWFNHIFHAFKGEFRTYRNLGVLVFSMFSFKIDQWVFIIG